MNRDDLKRKFNTEKGIYQNDIENKNATTYEDSKLFDIDIINVANDYDKAYDEFTSFANRMKNLTDDDTRFDDTITILNSNADSIMKDLDNINFSEISNFIRTASENVVFASYQEQFNDLNEESKNCIKKIENVFSSYDKYKNKLNNYESNYDNATDEIEKQNYKSGISYIKNELNNCLIVINSQLEKLKTNNILMIDILNKGLKKRTL